MSRASKKRLSIFVTVLTLIGLLGAYWMAPAAAAPGAASGNGVQPTEHSGNPTCSAFFDASEFLFEFKLEPVADGTFPLAFNGLTGSVTVDVRDTSLGQVFDFSFSGDFVALGVFVKGGPGGNLYDYSPDGEDADTGLHAPVNASNGRYFGLSHISFCLIEARAELQIEKTAVDDVITVGETASFDIMVTNLGPATAQNVTIDDTLPAGLNWTDNSDQCVITNGNVLHCDVGDLAKDASFTVRVSAEVPAGTVDENAAFCDTELDNTAFASADNADQVSDDATIRIQCGGLAIVKTAKHADTSGGTSPNLAATFQITDSQGNVHEVMTDGVTGTVCVDDLPLGDASVDEIVTPAGYAEDPDVEIAAVTDFDCGSGSETSVGFENVPLTDVDIVVDSQVEGGTKTVVQCFEANSDGSLKLDGNGNPILVGEMTTESNGDGALSLPDLEPQFISCLINIDP